jgi:hypothetical protein
MDAYDCRVLACVPFLPIAFFAMLRLYSTLFPLHWSKQTMIGWMDDQMNGRMDNGIDE